jgi:hypothetical protein
MLAEHVVILSDVFIVEICDSEIQKNIEQKRKVE